MKVIVDCICLSYEEPCFYFSKGNQISKTLVDPSKPNVALVFKRKLEFSEDKDIKASAMIYTIIKGGDINA
jgi:hypothetical protein